MLPLFSLFVPDTSTAQITVTALVHNPDRLVPLRIVFGKGEQAKEIRYLAFRREHVGKREITIRSVSHLPIDIEIVLRLEAESSISLAPVLDRADVRELRTVIQCLEALKSSPFIELSSVELGVPLLAGDAPFSKNVELEEGLVQVITDAATVADRFGVSIRLPSRISDSDLSALIQLKRIATGEEFDADTISASMIKDKGLQDEFFSVSNDALAPFRFEPQSDADPVELFGTNVQIGKPIFECAKVGLKDALRTRKRYLAASDGDSIPIVWQCLGECRFFYGSPLDDHKRTESISA
jgi:hypothetical protein